MSNTENQVETLRDGAEVALDATLEPGAENQRLRERAEKAERERDEALHALELVREELTGADADWPSEAAEAQMVARVVKERDAARAEAEMLREALQREVPAECKAYIYEAADTSYQAAEFARAERLNERRAKLLAVLAATTNDWLAARDRALAERVRDTCYSIVNWGEGGREGTAAKIRALDLDALVGGES